MSKWKLIAAVIAGYALGAVTMAFMLPYKLRVIFRVAPYDKGKPEAFDWKKDAAESAQGDSKKGG